MGIRGRTARGRGAWPLVGALGGCLLLVTACSDDPQLATGAGGGQAARSAPPPESPAASPEPVEESPSAVAGEEPVAASPDPVTAECLVGTWRLDEASLGRAFESVAEQVPQAAGARFRFSGNAFIRFEAQGPVVEGERTFDRGVYRATRNLSMVARLEGRDGRVRYRFQGSEKGRYSALDGLLWIDGVTSLSSTTTMTQELGSFKRKTTLDSGTGTATSETVLPRGTVTTTVPAPADTDKVEMLGFYDCSDDTLTLSTDTGSVGFTRAADSDWPGRRS